ncbi:SbcC/MukB-like Walker B domain-containing protein [Bradyrhizobium sp. CB82]|uniref:SbcC/MukB-like Walker B domain-containing protein n=1 Tax=Bradyrhizobium sp. CB82 TaxID=3039159 RepID=UPI0024B05E0B|nr:SbcC/MukB-like Walker B domain-containing protein [Bradyrhizobium sp. CB82]WFU40779.1 SbcC/MukB-like Walker B domain-containing protein [Bradyrhizobium sp. CB82]
MHIAQVTTLNWGGLPDRDYPLGTYTLLAGESGSGKTHLIDAVVAVMGGGGSLKSKFNTAQAQAGQSSKKTQRTLASYVVGSDGMGRFLRPAGAHGYVCVSWNRDANDGSYGEPFTAIVGVEAAVDRDAAPVNDVTRVLIRGHVAGLEDLTSGPGMVLRPSELLVSLRLKYGPSVRDFKTNGEYLSMLYAHLKGDTTPVSREEADAAVKAFVSAIAYRQPNDIDGLIREEILENVNNEGLIQRLIETIREVTKLKIEAARMERNILRLEEADKELHDAFEAFMDERMFKALVDIRKALDVQEARGQKLEERKIEATALASVNDEIGKGDALEVLKREQLREVIVRMHDHTNYAKKIELENLINEQQRLMDAVTTRFAEAVRDFSKSSKDISIIENAVDAIPELAQQKEAVSALRTKFNEISLPALEAALKAIDLDLAESALPEVTRITTALITCLTTAWHETINAETGLRSALNQAYRNVDQQLNDLTTEARDILRRAERLKVGEVEYPPAVDLFLTRLRTQLPEANPRVLCDVVDVAKPEWQAALEGYIGYDRFTVLYDRNFEADVVKHAKAFRRENSGRRGDISVPQLSLAISDNPRVETDSIIHLLRIDKDVEGAGYLKARYGRTIRVHDTDTLKGTRSGVMQDGWSTQGYRYQQRRCPDEEMVFGAEIRRKQREILLRRGRELEIQKNRLAAQQKKLVDALAIASPASLALGTKDPSDFYDAAGLRQMGRDDLSKLDLSGFDQLEAQSKSLDAEITELARAVGKLREKKGGLEITINSLDGQIEKDTQTLEALQPAAERARDGHQELMRTAFLLPDEWPKRFEGEITAKRPVTSHERRSSERANAVTNAVNNVNNKLDAYNRDALDFQKIDVPVFSYMPRHSAEIVTTWMHDIWRQLRDQIRSQKETGLPERRAQCDMAERSFSSSFTTDFCSTVLSNVEGRPDTINVLNSNLEHINFGGDTFELVHSLRSEFEDYIRLFQKIRGLSETRKVNLDLFTAPELEPAERDTLIRIRDLLLDEQDGERALTELRRIADYRNYRTYDFQRARGDAAVLLSKWGSGSGGESETPIYVIRAAVMASAFKLFSQQKKAHFRSIFLDEVFAQMDETRTRRVLRFLKELGLQIVCAAPTRSTAAVLDEFDVRINFSKYTTQAGERSDVNVINLDRARVEALYNTHRKATTDKVRASFESTDPPELSVVKDDRSRIAQSGGGS